MERQTLGTMISSLRKQKSMTQAQLAEKMNITDKAVSKWERDLSCPDIKSLDKLSGILGVTVDELVQAVKAKECAKKETPIQKIKKLINLIFKAVTVAMGVAVVVLSSLNAIDISSAITLLGIGLFCAGMSLLQNTDD